MCGMRMLIYVAFMTLSLSIAGCFPHVHIVPAASQGEGSFPILKNDSDVLIGLALSGGGSRAALFGAAALEALAKVKVEDGAGSGSVLERISYISSVSGGSIAASYFAMEKPGHGVPVLTDSEKLTDEYQEFFNAYKEAMSANFQWGFEWRQILKVRWLNPSQRATSLTEVLDASFLNNRTLYDLYKREKNGDIPRLIINSTLYNNGRRFVITTLPEEAFAYDFINELRLWEQQTGKKILTPSLEEAIERFVPLSFNSVQADPKSVPVSYAVAASASFPPIIGPVTVQVEGTDKYWHAGDGGMFDNRGAESLAQVLLKQLDEAQDRGTPKRALLLIFDSGFPFSAGEEELNKSKKGYGVYLKDPARIVGIMEERANAYQTLFWNILQTTRGRTQRIHVIKMRHTEADLDVADLPKACKSSDAFKDKAAIQKHISRIPTLLKIRDKCDRELLAAAAAKVVGKYKDEIQHFLQNASK